MLPANLVPGSMHTAKTFAKGEKEFWRFALPDLTRLTRRESRSIDEIVYPPDPALTGTMCARVGAASDYWLGLRVGAGLESVRQRARYALQKADLTDDEALVARMVLSESETIVIKSGAAAREGRLPRHLGTALLALYTFDCLFRVGADAIDEVRAMLSFVARPHRRTRGGLRERVRRFFPRVLRIELLRMVHRLHEHVNALEAKRLRYNPVYGACGVIGGCDGDLVADSALFEPKLSRRKEMAATIRQLLVYIAVYDVNCRRTKRPRRIQHVGMILPRFNTWWISGVDQLVKLCGGRSREAFVGHFDEFVHRKPLSISSDLWSRYLDRVAKMQLTLARS